MTGLDAVNEALRQIIAAREKSLATLRECVELAKRRTP
jgi:hypothetical protein